jgi:hypothetical protein
MTKYCDYQDVSLDDALEFVREECIRAMSRFNSFGCSHEGYAVVLEELDEAWTAIKENHTEDARNEMVQVAAMAIRYIVDNPGLTRKVKP